MVVWPIVSIAVDCTAYTGTGIPTATTTCTAGYPSQSYYTLIASISKQEEEKRKLKQFSAFLRQERRDTSAYGDNPKFYRSLQTYRSLTLCKLRPEYALYFKHLGHRGPSMRDTRKHKRELARKQMFKALDKQY